jgi:hypothetical protein|tara:strand:+ start:160 stop:528 length:369 start_codon:yes stop_codon:yes gene_type:complete
MAANKIVLGSYLGNIVVSDTSVNATAQDNVTGAASTVLSVEIDNTANTGTMVFFKMYDSTNATVGTTVPSFVLPVQGGKKLVYATSDGFVFSSGVSYGCTTGAGNADTTAPSQAVSLLLIAS